MLLNQKPRHRFMLPLALAALCLLTPTVISQSANAQCNRPGFKLNFGYFANIANKTVAADFNADGKMDMAATFFSSGKLSVYFGNGTGGFSAPVNYTVGNRIFKLLSADMNNDAKPDLILVVDSFNTDRTISVLLNNGAGAFAAPVDNTISFDLTSAQLADLNGDGKSDLLTLTIEGGNHLAVRFGNGLGQFASTTEYPSAVATKFLVGNFGGDSKPDVCIFRSDGTTGWLTIYTNNGAGGLVAGTEMMLDNASRISVARDFNGDGKADIAGHTPGNAALMLLLNNGSGGFNRTDYPLPMASGDFRAGEFNGDGKIDLMGGRFESSPARAFMLYGNGAGGFTQGETFGAGVGWTDQGDLADLNGDGKSDLVTGAGGGVRAFLRTCNDVSNTRRIDYDGDGQGDFAVWHPADGSWIIDQSSTNTRRTQQWGNASFGDVPVAGDYDGDGKSDLAVFRAPTGGWYILKSSDNTLLGVQWGVSGDKPVPGDYDADGKTDVAVFRQSDGGWYILRSSDNSLSAFVFGASGDKPVQADYDNDDKTDVAVFRPSNGYWYMLKSSDGSFVATHFGINTDKPVPADYDGDGRVDIAVYRPTVGFYYLSTWNNEASGEADFRYSGTPSPLDVPAPMKRNDYFIAYIWRPADGMFGSLLTSGSNPIGTSGDIPVVAPYVVE